MREEITLPIKLPDLPKEKTEAPSDSKRHSPSWTRIALFSFALIPLVVCCLFSPLRDSKKIKKEKTVHVHKVRASDQKPRLQSSSKKEKRKKQKKSRAKRISKIIRHKLPTVSKEKTLLSDLIEKYAKRLYLEGYAVKSFDPGLARKKWKSALKLLPRDHPIYQKAQAQLGSVHK